MFGGGHTSTNYDSLNTFDLNTLKWIEEYPPTPCSWMTKENFHYGQGYWRQGPPDGPYPRAAARHTTDQLVVVGDEFIVLTHVEGNGPCTGFPKYTSYDFTSLARPSHYNFQTRTWSFSTADGGQQWPGAEYDPVSKKIVLLGVVGLDIYDPATKTKRRAIDLSRSPVIMDQKGNRLPNHLYYNNNLVYFPPNQKMYYFENRTRRVYELNLNRQDFSKSTITRLDSAGTPPPGNPIGYAYDPVNRVIGGGPIRNTFYVYDPEANEWKSRVVEGGTPGSIAFHAIAFDPVNNVFIFVTDRDSRRRTWAYRYSP